MTVCVCVLLAPAEACRGGRGPPGVSRRNAGGEESDHTAMSDLTGEPGKARHKCFDYRQPASDTGDTHEREYHMLLLYIVYCCIHITQRSTKKNK